MAIPDHSAKALKDLLSLSGRTAVITGAGRGIGLAIAWRLAEAGAELVLGDLDERSVIEAAEGLQSEFGVRVSSTVVDVRSEKSVEALAHLATHAASTIDIWVNNAAIYPFAHIADTSPALWDDVMEINLRGTFLGLKAAASRMRIDAAERPKVILNISSTSGLAGREGLSHYAASKHGVLGLTKSAARELGPAGIRVLAIAPTIVNTPGMTMRNAVDDPGSTALEERIAVALPLQRVGVPDDVARVALFCVSDMAALMTGSVVLVDAGAMAG